MNRITTITKQDIRDLFVQGVGIDLFLETQYCKYPYHGKLNQLDFLKRLYNLRNFPSIDPKFKNAEEDIWQHTVNNDDYSEGWIFDDGRFPLKDGTDEDFLNFIREILHPEVRIENETFWACYQKICQLLKIDGYEIYVSGFISDRYVYDWRELTEMEITQGRFLPFSMRNKQLLENKTIQLTIPLKLRKEIIRIMDRREGDEELVTETNWHYTELTKTVVFDDIKKYYEPHCFDGTKKYVPATDLDGFILQNYPKFVFDAIELFSHYQSINTNPYFTKEINNCISQIGWQLVDGKIIVTGNIPIQPQTPEKDENLKELLQQANTYFKRNNSDDKKLAVEKVWDAFERLKTYFSLDKQKSIRTILETVASDNNDLKQRIDEEFNRLTKIGNTYQIRHFEAGKIPIADDNLREYLYYRCLALINYILKSLEKSPKY